MKQELTYICPFCDREVRVGAPCGGCSKKRKPAPAKAKPKAKAKRSWEQDKIYDDLDLPDEDFDYDEFVAKEFGHLPHKKIGVKLYWWLLGIVLLVMMALLTRALNRLQIVPCFSSFFGDLRSGYLSLILCAG